MHDHIIECAKCGYANTSEHIPYYCLMKLEVIMRKFMLHNPCIKCSGNEFNISPLHGRP